VLRVGSRFLTLALILNLFGFAAFGEDHIISVFDSNSKHHLLSLARPVLMCKNAADAKVDQTSVVRVQRTASYSVHNGVRDDSRRGIQMHERSIEEFDGFSQAVIYRLLFDWKTSGRYSAKELIDIFDLHRSLSRHRLKLITVENDDPANPFTAVGMDRPMESRDGSTPPTKFSAIRIYDSSTKMKSFGRSYSVPQLGERDMVDLVERNFPGFNLTKALTDLGIPRAAYTWTLGLTDVSGVQRGAMKTLTAQVADLLDLHYNRRDFFNIDKLDAIQKDDVDIVFYGVDGIRKHYEKELGLVPLRGADGEFLQFRKGEKDYFVFHVKGSRFIEKFLNMRFHSPLYGSKRALRNEQETRDYFSRLVKGGIWELSPQDYQVRDLNDLINKLEPLVRDFAHFLSLPGPLQTEAHLARILGGFFLLRRDLPDDIFKEVSREQSLRDLKKLDQLLGGIAPPEMGPLGVGKSVATLATLEFLLRDPMSYLINNANLAK